MTAPTRFMFVLIFATLVGFSSASIFGVPVHMDPGAASDLHLAEQWRTSIVTSANATHASMLESSSESAASPAETSWYLAVEFCRAALLMLILIPLDTGALRRLLAPASR